MKCKDCLHFDPWTVDYVGKDKKPFRHMLGNFGERGDKGRCKTLYKNIKGNPSKKFPVYKFAEDEACELYEPRKGEMF